MVFVVELDCLGSFVEWYTNAHLAHGVVRACDWLEECAQEEAAGGEDTDVDDAYGLAADDVRIEFGALSVAVFVGKDTDVGLDYTCHLGIDIAARPG